MTLGEFCLYGLSQIHSATAMSGQPLLAAQGTKAYARSSIALYLIYKSFQE